MQSANKIYSYRLSVSDLCINNNAVEVYVKFSLRFRFDFCNILPIVISDRLSDCQQFLSFGEVRHVSQKRTLMSAR